MRTTTPFLRNFLFLLVAVLALTPVRAAAQNKPVASRVLRVVDDTDTVTLKGHMHPLARPEFDRGISPDDLPMQRMLLMLKRSPEQDAALKQLMAEQYDTASPSFHKWLTPEQFGEQFGPADADIEAVTSWLKLQGFQVSKVSKGKLAIEFSGTAGQLKTAFHTEVHKYIVGGQEHWANAREPQIPAALSPVVVGFASLNDFRPKPMHHVVGRFTKTANTGEIQDAKPELTNGSNYFISPFDFAKIYNVLPLWNATPTAIDGSGQSIAVIGVSNINMQDVRDFRSFLGLPAKDPIVVIDGTDPGVLADGSEIEALLDIEWSGAVAKNAQIHYVTAADTNDASGLLLAVFNVIDNNSDPIMSLSFGTCEINLGTSGNSFFSSVWQQASAQGITVTVSSGDTGSAGCEDQNASAPNPATTGLQVSGFASTPFNVAVGGTDFNDAGTQTTYFNPTNDATKASAKGYIPESTWNDSCTNASFSVAGSTAETNCNASANASDVITVAGSGGKSHCTTVTGATCSGGYAKPTFQSLSGLTGMPADSKRDIPDVSLFASDGFNKSSYVVCDSGTEDSTKACLQNGTFSFIGVGGTSASTPAFAGILALINQSEVAHSRSGRQGNANFVLYQLAKQQFQAATLCASVASPLPVSTCTFNDVTAGTIAMPCAKGSTDCNTAVPTHTYGVLSGVAATAGYDLATGLGSVNVANLVNNWGLGLTALTSSGTTLTLNNGSSASIVHGTDVPVTISVTPTSATGPVSLVSTATTGDGVDGFTLAAGGTVTSTTNQLTGGTYTVKAHYPGDGIVGPSDSNAVTVTVTPQASSTFLTVLDSLGNTVTGGAAPLSVILRADVIDSGNLGNWLATGTVNFVDTSTSPSTTLIGNVAISSESAAYSSPVTLTAGTHHIVAQYSGDPSFNASNSSSTTITVTGATTKPTTITVAANPSTVATGATVTLTGTATATTNGATAAPTGTISFKANGTAISGTVTYTRTAGTASTAAKVVGTLTTTFSAAGPESITATFSGDSVLSASGPSTATSVTVNAAATTATTTTVSATPLNVNTAVNVTITGTATANAVGVTPAPSGTITFIANGVTINKTPTYVSTAGTASTAAKIVATIAGSFSAAGTENITATYSGDANFSGSGPSTPTAVSVNVVATGTTVAANPTAATSGATVTLTATATATASGVTATPSGTVTFQSNGTTIAGTPTYLFTAGTASTHGKVVATLATTSLAVGNDSVTATYNGDNNFTGSGPSAAVNVLISAPAAAASTTTVAANPTTVATGATVTLTGTATANSNGVTGTPTGTITFKANGANISGTVTYTKTAGTASTPAKVVGTLTTSFSTAGPEGITATFGGDTVLAASGPSTAVTVTVNGPPTVAIIGTNLTVTAGATAASGTSTITVTPSNGFTGNVAVTCASAGLPAGVSCSTANINVTGASAVTGTLTVTVAPYSTTLTASLKRFTSHTVAGIFPSIAGKTSRVWTLGSSFGFAGILFFLLPRRKKYRAALGMSLVCTMLAMWGCGGGSSGGGGGGVTKTATNTSITASGSKAAGFSFTATVTGGTPAGTVQFTDGAVTLGTVPVSGGAAMLPSPSLPGIGTQSVKATYSGDSTTLSSSSGAVTVTETGHATVTISSTPGSSNGTFILTIN